jgi:hypothetical protein
LDSAVDGTEKTLPTVFGKGGATFGPEWFPDGRSLPVGETDHPNQRRRISACGRRHCCLWRRLRGEQMIVRRRE